MLPYFGQLQGVELQCDEGSEDSLPVCLWAEEDMVSSFNLFRKGRAWDRRGDVATEGKIQQAHGVPSQPEKSHGPALQLDTLGTLFDGAFGAASTPRQLMSNFCRCLPGFLDAAL